MIDRCKQYTPAWVAEFIVQFLYENIGFPKGVNILEPSCGNGSFLAPLEKLPHANVAGVDFDMAAIEFCKERFKKSKLFHQDFLDHHGQYDFIVGNPPYISKKHLSIEAREKCKLVAGAKRAHWCNNMWVAFVLHSVSILNDNGTIAFVIPAEVLQVYYGKNVIEYLRNVFEKIFIIASSKRFFEKIDQNTVVLVCSGFNKKNKIFQILEIDENLNHIKFENVGNDLKLTHYHVGNTDRQLVNKLQAKFDKIGNLCHSTPGIVTACNEFYILPLSDIEKYNLSSVAIPIVKKGMYLEEKIVFSNCELLAMQRNGTPCYFVDLKSDKIKNIAHYIELGEKNGYQNRFKMRHRKIWYEVPQVWASDAVFMKRMHKLPKFYINRAKALVTDTGYRVTANQGIDVERLVMSFYNSITLLFVEIFGRSYGGGVLELTPSEFKMLPIHITSDIKYTSHDKMTLLQQNDKELISKGIISSRELKEAKKLYFLLQDRRLSTKRS